jgi:hypothetical protein
MRPVTELTRLRYWHGQRLRADDFRLHVAVEDEFRWWHNRAFHSALGVADGIGLQWLPDEDAPQTVHIQAGAAYDGYGRELLLAEKTELALPELSEDGRALLVLQRGRTGRVEVSWSGAPPGRCDGIVLAGVARDAAGPVRPAGTFVAHVRPLARPRLATGETPHTNTPWEPWKVCYFNGFRLESIVFGVQARVDTSAAGFTTTPHYFANVLWNSAEASFAPAMFGHVADATPRGFTYRLLLRGIGRQVLQVTHGVAMAVARGDRSIEVSDAEPFLEGDLVARIHPKMRTFAVVKGVAGNVITLSKPLTDVPDDGMPVAHGFLPRTAKVAEIDEEHTELQLDAALQAQGVGVLFSSTGELLGVAPLEQSSPRRVSLFRPRVALKQGDRIAAVKQAAIAASVEGGRVVIDTPGAFAAGDVLVTLPAAVQHSDAAIVDHVQDDGVTLNLRSSLSFGGNAIPLGKPQASVEIRKAQDVNTTVTVEGNVPFLKGDVVCHLGHPFPTAAIVENVRGKKVVLSRALEGLAEGRTIASGTFPVRTTVQTVSVPTGKIKVGSSQDIVTDDLLFAITSGDVVHFVGPVITSANGEVELGAAASRVNPGDVVGPVRPPAIGELHSVSADGLELELAMSGKLREGDAVAVREKGSGSVAYVKELTANGVRLWRPLEGVTDGDSIGFLYILGPVHAEPEADTSKYRVSKPALFRKGDLVGNIAAWRAVSAPLLVDRIDESTLHLKGGLDGLLEDDGIGAADFTSATAAAIRLKTVDGMLLTDQVALAGEDTGSGVFTITLGVINNIDTAAKRITLTVTGTPRLRPEAMSAATLYHSRFTDTFTALARKEGLYVTWLACQGQNRDPSKCPERPPEAENECGKEI